MTHLKRKAFTLTELLVVVVIVGVLAAVVLPKFSKVMETRKTTEAEEMMAAVRTEQEARCSVSKNYTANFDKLASLNKQSDTKNYKYEDLGGVGIQASAKGSYEYSLQMPSYVDGRICCEGEDCAKLNKNYPSCADLKAQGDYVTGNAQCSAPDVCQLRDYTRTCQEEGYGSEYTGSVIYTVNADCSGYDKNDACTKPLCTEGETQGSQTCNKCGTQTTQVCRGGQWVEELGACSKTEAECEDKEGCAFEEEGIWRNVGETVTFCEGSDYHGCGKGETYLCKSDDNWVWVDDAGSCPLTQEEKESCKCDQSYLGNFKSCTTGEDGTKICKAECKYGYDGEGTCKYFCNHETGEWNNQGACEWDCKSNLRWVPSLTEIGCSPECNGWCANTGGSSQVLSDNDTANEFYTAFNQVPWPRQGRVYSEDEDLNGTCSPAGRSITMEQCTRPAWDGSSFHPNTIGEEWHYVNAPRKQIITLTCLAREDDHRDRANVGGWGDKLLNDRLLVLECPSGCETVADCVDSDANCGCGWSNPGHKFDTHCWDTPIDAGVSYEGGAADWDWWAFISGWGSCPDSGCPPADDNIEIQGGDFGGPKEPEVTCTSGNSSMEKLNGVCYCSATVSCSDGKSMDYGPVPCTCPAEPANNQGPANNETEAGCHTYVIMDSAFKDGRTGWCHNRTVCNGQITEESHPYVCQGSDQAGGIDWNQ